ncbi:MAG: nicotinate-nucleotide--dimethylbenzimidazole phosphoribosyltransferase [Bilifractor sp.]
MSEDRKLDIYDGLLEETIGKVQPLDQEAMEAAQAHWNAIAHPLHSLGKLEDLIIRIAGIQRTPRVSLSRKGLVTMCADNGVVEEGVTQTGQEVTAQVAENFLQEKATAGILCRKAGADIFPIDIGIARDTVVRNCKISYGTRNMTKGPAMPYPDAVRALETGIALVREKKADGYQILATGEMGIGNTTTSSALASFFLNQPVEKMTGRGAGLTSEGLQRKIDAIRKAIAVNHPDPDNPIDALAKIGGLDIAGMAGVFLGGAAEGIPVVIDGFISGVAALTATRICPAARSYMIASHMSREPASQMIMDALGMDPILHADMCLGEGTGAVVLFPILDMGLEVYNRMSTFEEDAIEAYKELK